MKPRADTTLLSQTPDRSRERMLYIRLFHTEGEKKISQSSKSLLSFPVVSCVFTHISLNIFPLLLCSSYTGRTCSSVMATCWRKTSAWAPSLSVNAASTKPPTQSTPSRWEHRKSTNYELTNTKVRIFLKSQPFVCPSFLWLTDDWQNQYRPFRGDWDSAQIWTAS